MKIFLGTVATILLLAVVAFAAVWFTPLRSFFNIQPDATIRDFPDYFSGDRPSPSGTSLPGGQTTATPQILWELSGKEGKRIRVTPFGPGVSTTSAPATPPDRITTLYGQRTSPEDDPAFAITYFPDDQSFTLTLYKEPLGSTRADGEAELLRQLSIPQNDACWLQHEVLTPDRVNSFYSGKNLGFSFCPGATQL